MSAKKKATKKQPSEAALLRREFPSWVVKAYLKKHSYRSLEQAIADDCFSDVQSDLRDSMPKKPVDDNSAIIVPIGDLSLVNLDDVKFDPNYESMTEDFIGTFNHGVTQGMQPQSAIFSMGSAFAVVLGCAIRAGLPQAQVGKLLMMVGRNAAVSSKMVQVLQGQSVGQAVANVMKAGKKIIQ